MVWSPVACAIKGGESGSGRFDEFTFCFSYSPTFPHPTDLGRLSGDGKTRLHPAGARAVPLEAGGDPEHRQNISIDYFLYGSLPHAGCNGDFIDPCAQ